MNIFTFFEKKHFNQIRMLNIDFFQYSIQFFNLLKDIE